MKRGAELLQNLRRGNIRGFLSITQTGTLTFVVHCFVHVKSNMIRETIFKSVFTDPPWNLVCFLFTNFSIKFEIEFQKLGLIN